MIVDRNYLLVCMYVCKHQNIGIKEEDRSKTSYDQVMCIVKEKNSIE